MGTLMCRWYSEAWGEGCEVGVPYPDIGMGCDVTIEGLFSRGYDIARGLLSMTYGLGYDIGCSTA
jgi:hypothetical protein